MADDDAIEALIREVAAKHGIAIGRNDPLLILHTVNKQLIADTSIAQKAMLDAFKAELEGIAQRWEADAKEKAEKILNAALNASKDAMKVAAQSNADVVKTAVQKELTALDNRFTTSLLDARRVAMMNMAAGGMVLIAGLILLWTFK